MLVTEAFVSMSGLVFAVVLIFISAHCLMALLDVEYEYLAPQVCCSKLNQWVIVEVASLAAVVLCHFISTNVYALLINTPVFFWTLYRFVFKAPRSAGPYDPDAMRSKRMLTFYSREAWAKLIAYVAMFVLLMFRLVQALLNASPAA